MAFQTRMTTNDRPGLLWRIITFPLTRIVIAIAPVNVVTFILRSLAEFLLFSLKIDNEICSNLTIFAVRTLTVYLMYVLFVMHPFQASADKNC